MIYSPGENGYIEVLEGIHRKTLVWGKNALMTEFRLSKGRVLPKHRHPEEQVGYLVSGHIILHIGDDSYDMLPGSSWAVPGDADHSADVLEDSVAVEVFAPVRKDYLP